MPLTFEESHPLSRFVYDTNWTPVWGAYIYPLKYFGSRDKEPIDPNSFLEIIHTVDCGDHDVVITRGGGLFARVEDSRTPKEVNRVAKLLSFVLCEYTLNGLISQAIADTDIQMGKLIDQHVAIAGGFGSYGERTWGPLPLLLSQPRDIGTSSGRPENSWWAPKFYWLEERPETITRVTNICRAVKLAACGEAIPALVVAAGSHASRYNLAETILTAWIVCEAILSYKWKQYMDSRGDAAQRRRLQDHRAYTASIQCDFLFAIGQLSQDAYDALHKARKVRNDLAHGASMSIEGASLAIDSLKKAIDWMGVDSSDLPPISFVSGGIGGPTTSLEPTFPFR